MDVSKICTKRTVLFVVITGLLCLYIGTLLTKKCTALLETRCLTDECLSASTSYKWSMDTSIDPCDDFYEYSCGQWNADRDNASVFQRTNKKIIFLAEKLLNAKKLDTDFPPEKQSKIFYRSCMNPYYQVEPNSKFFAKYLKYLGLSAIPQYLHSSITKPVPTDVVKLERNMMKAFSTFYFFKIESSDDLLVAHPFVEVTIRSDIVLDLGNLLNLPRNTTRRIRRSFDDTESSGDDAEGSGIGGRYPDDDYILGGDDYDDEDVDPRSDDLSKYYIGLASATELKYKLIKLGYMGTMKDINGAAEKIKSLQMKIRVLSGLSQYSTVYSIKSIEDNLEQILRLNKVNVTQTLTKFTKMLVNFIKENHKDVMNIKINFNRVGEFFSMLESLPAVDIELYMWYTAVTEIGSTYTRLGRFDQFRLSKHSCTKLVIDLMGTALSYALTDSLYNDNIKAKVERMTIGIHDAYNDAITESGWMNMARRDAVLKKSLNMSRIIGHSKITKDKSILEDYYKNIQLSEDDFVGNIFDLYILLYNGDISKFALGSAKSPVTVNAHYDVEENSINVPMGILNQPIYNLGLDALNYGALGSIIGHEITHGFSYKDVFKNSNSYESSQLEDKLQCFKNQYIEYHQTARRSLITHLKGFFTIGENVADTSGIHLSYTSYKKLRDLKLKLPGFESYTHDQLFFIAYANVWCGEINMTLLDNHSANRYRVTAALQNSIEFAESFKCQPGTRMNPKRTRCDLFN